MFSRMKAVLHVAGGMMAITLAGCATYSDQGSGPPPPPDNVPFSSLEGTNWQLVEFQSMDDRQGITRPDDPAKYTLSFNADGRLAVRLDCNRGMGPWKNEIANATGGSLEIGPLAVTKALCPEPTMGEFLERQIGYVRSFMLRDGRMYMSLMADGGIIVWEPAAEAD